MIENRCAFTGHRPKKFSWGYNEADARCVALKKALAAEIAKLVDTGYTRFYSGMGSVKSYAQNSLRALAE